MRRDTIDKLTNEGESEFVARMWTEVWQAQLDPFPEPPDLSETEEFRAIEPWLRSLSMGAEILDAGCGLGDWTRFLSARGFRTTGLDLSASTIQRLRRLFPDQDFVAGDFRDTGFDAARFDAELSWGAFEHFEEGLGRCIGEAERVLKPGGYLFITVPLENLRVRFLSRKPTKGRFYQWRFRPGELRQELMRGGFEVLDIRPIGSWEGARRTLVELLRLDPARTSTMRAATALAAVLPAPCIAHMQTAVAQKAKS